MTELVNFATTIGDKTLRTKFLCRIGQRHPKSNPSTKFSWEYLNELLNQLQP